jgi:hypothetical protein
MLPLDLYARVRTFCAHCTRDRGAARTRSSLRPLSSGGTQFEQSSGNTCRENAKSYLLEI